jgi:MraZ protein
VSLLTGEFELTLDDKKRISIPSRVREQLLQAEESNVFYLVLGVNRILSLYPERYYERIALAVAPRTVAPDESLAFDRVNSALAGRVELDRQGRVLLPDKAIRRAGLREFVTLIGVRDYLEIWDTDRWESYLEEHIDAHEKMLLQAREETKQRDRELDQRLSSGIRHKI